MNIRPFTRLKRILNTAVVLCRFDVLRYLFLCVGVVGKMALFANSVTLVNDSPFPLDTTLYAADGTVLGQYALQPQAQQKWSDDSLYGTNAPNPKESQTPYTVIWMCQEGSQYGVCTNVSPGSEIFAQGCQGPLMCQPKKKAVPGQPQPPH